MSQKFESAIAVIGIDIGKNSFHVVGLDERGGYCERVGGDGGGNEGGFVSTAAEGGTWRAG